MSYRSEYNRTPRRWFLISLAALVALGIWAIAAQIDAYAFTAELRLADDASSAQKKAEHLTAFIAKVEKTPLPQHGAWVVSTEQNRIGAQVEILRSLVERCEETAGLDRESFGYAQGMTQITGQEFDHAIGSLQGIFGTAILKGHGWIACWAWIASLVAAVIFGGWWVVAS